MELLRRIIELATTTDETGRRRDDHLRTLFQSLSLVNHTWEEVSRPFLYQSVAITDEPGAEALMRTLDEHPDRAALLKAFALKALGSGEWRDRIVLYLLKHCSNLKEMDLEGIRGEEWTTAWNPLLGESCNDSLSVI